MVGEGRTRKRKRSSVDMGRQGTRLRLFFSVMNPLGKKAVTEMYFAPSYW